MDWSKVNIDINSRFGIYRDSSFKESSLDSLDAINDFMMRQAQSFIEENIELLENDMENFLNAIPFHLINKVFDILQKADIEITQVEKDLFNKKLESILTTTAKYFTRNTTIMLDSLGVNI